MRQLELPLQDRPLEERIARVIASSIAQLRHHTYSADDYADLNWRAYLSIADAVIAELGLKP